MSQDLENNKIIAAILVAGIVAYFGSFLAKHVFVTVHDEEKAYIDIDTSAVESAAGGDAKPVGPEPILALLATADVKKGEALSKACMACHGFEKGGANKVGPNLWGLIHGPKAHKADFAYSDALKQQHEAGEKWNYQSLNNFIWKPASVVPGTKMAYPGLKKAQDRADLLAYMRTQMDSPAALPSDADIAAEMPKEEPKEAVEEAVKVEADAKLEAAKANDNEAVKATEGVDAPKK